MKRSPLLAAIGALSALALSACASATPATTPAGESAAAEQVSISLVRQLGAGDYYEQWLSGAQAQADALGVDLKVSNANGDDSQHVLDLQSAVNQKPGAIIVDHGNAETIQPGVDAAVAAGIPVVSFDSGATGDSLVTVTQSDKVLASSILEKLVTDTGGSGKVIYVYVAGFDPLDRRNEVWEEVRAANPGLEQVAQIGVVDNNTAAGVADQAKAALQANSDVKAIFAPYDEFAKGATLAVQELGLEGQVTVYGADISTADIEVLTADNSPWVATAATDPANVGAVTVRAAYLKATGAEAPALVEIPPTLLTAEDLKAKGVTTIADLTAAFPELKTDDLVPVA